MAVALIMVKSYSCLFFNEHNTSYSEKLMVKILRKSSSLVSLIKV